MSSEQSKSVFDPKPSKRRYDFVLFFEVREGNPNGDPDAGNLPRTDPLTQEGLVTDVSIKRKWRDYVSETKKGELGFDIFVKHSGILANEQKRAIADSQNVEYDKAAPIGDTDPKRSEKIEMARVAACHRFVDVRTFGAVMTTGKVIDKSGTAERAAQWNCGQVKGPVQLTFARSAHKISPVQWSIARVAQTNPGENQEHEEGESEHGTFGQKPTIGYALYRAHGFVSPSLAEKTEFSPTDLELLFQGLADMYNLHTSASAGMQSTRDLFVFEHDDKYGKYHASRLFDTIKEIKNDGNWVDDYPTKPSCFTITTDFGSLKNGQLPRGVTLWRWDFDERRLAQMAKGPSDANG